MDMFQSIISEDLFSDMQCIEGCIPPPPPPPPHTLDFNLAEVTPIRDLPGQFGTCAQQCESGQLS